jgi:hypothetical protein
MGSTAASYSRSPGFRSQFRDWLRFLWFYSVSAAGSCMNLTTTTSLRVVSTWALYSLTDSIVNWRQANKRTEHVSSASLRASMLWLSVHVTRNLRSKGGSGGDGEFVLTVLTRLTSERRKIRFLWARHNRSDNHCIVSQHRPAKRCSPASWDFDRSELNAVR